MTNSEIFKAAHRQAKRNQFNFGTYAKRLSIALKAIYLRIRTSKRMAADRITSELVAAKKQAISFAKYTSSKTEPVSSYFSFGSWEAKLSA